MGLPAPSGRRPRTEAQPCRCLRLGRSAGSASGTRLANTGRGVPWPIDGCVGTGRLTPCRGGAVNLWTVGCADPRLTAPARSPMDKPGKTQCVSPTLPTGRRLPHKLHSTPQQHGMILISGNGEISSRLHAFSLFFPGSCPKTGTVAEVGLKIVPSGTLFSRAGDDYWARWRP